MNGGGEIAILSAAAQGVCNPKNIEQFFPRVSQRLIENLNRIHLLLTCSQYFFKTQNRHKESRNNFKTVRLFIA